MNFRLHREPSPRPYLVSRLTQKQLPGTPRELYNVACLRASLYFQPKQRQPLPGKIPSACSSPTWQNRLLFQYLFLLIHTGYPPSHTHTHILSFSACPWLPLPTCRINLLPLLQGPEPMSRAQLAKQALEEWEHFNPTSRFATRKLGTHTEMLPMQYRSVFCKKTWISATRETQKLVSYSLHSSIPLGTLCKGNH